MKWDHARLGRLSLLVAATLFWPQSGWSWSDAGHKIIASIAYRQLTPEQRTTVAEWIRSHPRFSDDYRKPMPEEVRLGAVAEQEEWLFQQASVWPDLARGFPDALKETYHRSPWHYVNRPLFLSERDGQDLGPTLKLNTTATVAEETWRGSAPNPPLEMNVIQTIYFCRKALARTTLARIERGRYVPWLFHTVGDLHQPLHAAAFFTPQVFPDGDRGGNAIPTPQRGNLHQVWDQLPGRRIEFREARNRALGLLADPEHQRRGTSAAETLAETAWWDESFLLATDVVYDAEVRAFLRQLEANFMGGDLPELRLSEEYLKTAGRLAERRLVEAGFRLGAVLREVVGGPSPR